MGVMLLFHGGGCLVKEDEGTRDLPQISPRAGLAF